MRRQDREASDLSGLRHTRILRALAKCALVFSATVAAAQTSLEAGWILSPELGGVRRWEVVDTDVKGFATPNRQSEAILTVSSGAILTNLGCEPADDHLWCEVKDGQNGVKGFVSASHLRPAIGPDGTVAMGVDDSRKRARKRDFDATERVACAQEQGEALGKCKSQVARSGGGDATVVVTFSNGFQRSLYFKFGEFVRASSTMSGVGTDIDWSLEKDAYAIRVDDQQFVVSKSFVMGID